MQWMNVITTRVSEVDVVTASVSKQESVQKPMNAFKNGRSETKQQAYIHEFVRARK